MKPCGGRFGNRFSIAALMAKCRKSTSAVDYRTRVAGVRKVCCSRVHKDRPRFRGLASSLIEGNAASREASPPGALGDEGLRRPIPLNLKSRVRRQRDAPRLQDRRTAAAESDGRSACRL